MLKYWVWLSLALNTPTTHLMPLLQKYNNPHEIYKTPVNDLEKTFILSQRELDRLSNKSLVKSLKIIEECKNSSIEIITFDNPLYPQSLKQISNPPACLYVKGKQLDLNKLPIICIVGARKASEHSKLVAWSLAGRLAAGGMVVLSGGATGVDGEAHEGAMAVGGKTVAVLPCGINYNYLKTNAFMRSAITDSGCLISEHPPKTPLYKNAFQIRNRLLTALSKGVVIVEAARKSGTMITARYAAEQSKDVFVITGRPGDKNYEGSNELLRDGAKPVFEADDVFCEYIAEYGNLIDVEKAKKTNLNAIYRILHTPKKFTEENKFSVKNDGGEAEKRKIKKILDETLPNSAKIVYNYLDRDVFTADDVVECGLSFEEILSGITQLELYGYIKALPGGRFSIIY